MQTKLAKLKAAAFANDWPAALRIAAIEFVAVRDRQLVEEVAVVRCASRPDRRPVAVPRPRTGFPCRHYWVHRLRMS